MKAIRVLRAEAGLTGTALAARSGVTREQISRIEHGHYEPNAATLGKLAKALGVTVEEIYALQERLDAAKAGAREIAGRWVEARAGHSYLALTDDAAVEVVANASSIDEVTELKEAVDDERDIAKSFLEDHTPPPELREALQEAVRKHLFWLIDLSRRRKELREAGEGKSTEVLVGMNVG